MAIVIIRNCEAAARNQLLVDNGTGNFTVTNLPPDVYFNINDIAVGDMNNGGFQDIVIANGNELNKLLLNDGAEGFIVKDLPGGARITRDITVVDVDDDSDLVFAGTFDAASQLLLNDGSGNFTALEFPQTNRTNALSASDMNNDRFVDIVIGQPNGYGYANPTAIKRCEWKLYNCRTSWRHLNTFVVATDFNNIGFQDILFGNVGNANDQLLINKLGIVENLSSHHLNQSRSLRLNPVLFTLNVHLRNRSGICHLNPVLCHLRVCCPNQAPIHHLNQARSLFA